MNQTLQLQGIEGWPEGIPQNYNELFSGEWSKFIAAKVRRYNKVDRNFADIFQEISLRLIQARVLECFVMKSATRLPEEMTSQQACDYIGISLMRLHKTRESYNYYLKHGHYKPKAPTKPISMPDPIRNGRTGWFRIKKNLKKGIMKSEGFMMPGVYARVDVLEMSEMASRSDSGWNLDQPNRTMRLHAHKVIIAPTGAGFKTYLAQAIHNHFANFCRGRSRHYSKEHLLDSTTVVTGGGAGNSYQISGTQEEQNGQSSWERNLTGETLDPNDMFWQLRIMDTLRDKCAEVGVDITKIGECVLAKQDEGGGPTERAKSAIRILEAVIQSIAQEPKRANETMDHRIQRLIEEAIRKSTLSLSRNRGQVRIQATAAE